MLIDLFRIQSRFSSATRADSRDWQRRRNKARSGLGTRADSIARARQDSINRASPGYVIDSVLPVEEEIRRFRAAVGGATAAELQHASASRTELVERFVRDLATPATRTDLRSAP